MSELLKAGDVIKLEQKMRVYADVPEHFVYGNKRGSFKITHHDIFIEGELTYFAGEYIVTHTTHDGGGQSSDGGYPNGHHVFCVRADDPAIRVDFYQTGCFTAMLPDIQPIGRAKLTWTVEEPGGE